MEWDHLLSLLQTRQVPAVNYIQHPPLAAGIGDISDPSHLTTQMLQSTHPWHLSHYKMVWSSFPPPDWPPCDDITGCRSAVMAVEGLMKTPMPAIIVLLFHPTLDRMFYEITEITMYCSIYCKYCNIQYKKNGSKTKLLLFFLNIYIKKNIENLKENPSKN